MEKIVFDGREAARPVRNDKTIKPFLADADDARTGTVVLKDNTPERVVNKVAGEAAETREKEAEKFGQVPLTDEERKQIDFTETSVPAARSAKGIAAGEGVDDFLAHFDETLTVDENREVFKRAKREGGGTRNSGRETGTNAQRLAQANKRRKAEQGGRIRQYALVEQDAGAQDELAQQPGGVGETFDIGFNQDDGRIRGSGEDFSRLEERHENRSERAQSVDERRSAQVTRDPIQWANNPAKYDFPGIDTIQPQELHEQRSERAQETDENELAPPADTKEQWANNPDEYDWPGVDTPPKMGLGPNQEQPAPVPDGTDDRPDPALAAQEGPSTDREQTRSVMGELQERDVSASPGELFEGVGVERQTSGRQGFGLADGEEADLAFLSAENERRDAERPDFNDIFG